MAEATTIDQVRAVARETEGIMREENSNWFGVMRWMLDWSSLDEMAG
jgi:hypothetical protein